MKSNIYIMLEKFFDDSVINVAKNMNYSEENILILENKENDLKQRYPEIYNNLLSCRHNRDFRTPMQYAQDLVCSWLYEDYLLDKLKHVGINIKLSGEDRNRKILSSARVSSNSDYLIEYNGKKAFIELANDYTGYWKNKKQCDLRDDKFLHIKNGVKDADFSFLLGVDFKNIEFFIVDVNDSHNITYSNYHYAYHKPAYSIHLNDVQFYSFNIINISNIIKELMS